MFNYDGQLNWTVANYTVSKCVSYYRVVYWDSDTNNPIDLYVKRNNFHLLNATPCTVYKVRISAIVDSPDLEGPVTETLISGKALGMFLLFTWVVHNFDLIINDSFSSASFGWPVNHSVLG